MKTHKSLPVNRLCCVAMRDRDTFIAMEILGLLGTALVVLRTIAGLSQAEAAQRAGMKASQLGKYENDRVRPRLEQLDRILAAYGATLFDLADVLAMLRKPELARAAADKADEIRESAGSTVLLREGGMLIPRASQEIVVDLMARVFRLLDSTREVVVGRAMRKLELE